MKAEKKNMGEKIKPHHKSARMKRRQWERELCPYVRLQVYDFAQDKPALVSRLSNASQSKFALGGSKHSQLIEELGGEKTARANTFFPVGDQWHEGFFYSEEEMREECSGRQQVWALQFGLLGTGFDSVQWGEKVRAEQDLNC